MGGGGEFFGNNRIAFGPNQTLAQAITLTNPVLDQAPYPADGTGQTNQLTNQTAFGQYISDQIKVGESLHISLGFRHDDQRVHGLNTLSPALTTFSNELSANTKQVGVVYDIAYDDSGNSSFPPESGVQREVGLKFDTPAKDLNVSVAAYEINRTNVLVGSGTNFQVPTGSAQVGQAIFRLDGKQQSRGFEVEAQWQPIGNWQLQAGYAYSKAIIAASIKNPTTVGLDLANAPRVSGNFWTRYNFTTGRFQGLGIGTGIIYVGNAWAGDPTTTVYYRLPNWTRVDSSLYYKWGRYDASLNIQNLLDKRYIGSAQSAITLNVGEQRKLTFSLGAKF
jgi:iron complex outermembrane receptor protein